MDLESCWLPLADAVERLLARGVQEVKAKVDICAAIQVLRLRVRVHADDKAGPPAIYEINSVEIPIEINPTRLDWAGSRPAELYPWRTLSFDGWRTRNIVLIEVSIEDFAVELCDDTSLIKLPDIKIADPSSSLEFIEELQELALAAWSPSQATADALSRLSGRATISLSEAVSIMALAADGETAKRDKRKSALRQQAGRALCDAAWSSKVVLRGSRRQGDEVKPILDDYFEVPRCLANYPNSVERDHEQGLAAPPRSIQKFRSSIPDDDPAYGEVLHGARFDVEVEVGSFSKWLNHEISVGRERQLRRRRSQRLFNYPFWSMETALCWIAFRDSTCLKSRPDDTRSLPRSGSGDEYYAEVESQPEIKLLKQLQSGRLQAQEQDRVLKQSYWTECSPVPGGLSPAARSVRLVREKVLRLFPQISGHSDVDGVLARREAKIKRIIEGNRKTRRWISCAEIADWFTGGDHGTRRSNIFGRLGRTFTAGGFHVGGRSQLRLLDPNTSVVLFSSAPVDGTGGQKRARDPFEPPVPHYLERCWLPNEILRDWCKQQKLSWPNHFQKTSSTAKEDRTSPPPFEAKIERQPGRPLIVSKYTEEFELTLSKGSLSRTLKEETNKLWIWGERNLAKGDRVKLGTVENYIRNRLKSWHGDIPWKAN
jgi:hypothetical protein